MRHRVGRRNLEALMMHDVAITRRHFFGRAAAGLGGAAMVSMLAGAGTGGPTLPHFRPRARRVIYLFQSGGPSQVDLWDHKPRLRAEHGLELPQHVRRSQRLTGMSANQSSIPVAGSPFEFKQAGDNGLWVSELVPHTAGIVDDLCVVRSMHTEAINHDPAMTFFQTGSQIAGRPSMGAWLSYGLGAMNQNLPAFVVLVSAGQGGQPLYSRLWDSGFLDSRHQGLRFQPGADPVVYLSNPDGVCRSGRRAMLDRLSELNRRQYQRELDPEIESWIAQCELAYRMQTSVPDVTDLSDEPDEVFELYGEDARKPGTYAANCLLARRLAERDVRFIQLYHQGWDQHGQLAGALRAQCRETDQASAALVLDLKRRGMLEDTLVIWGGEFGRTSYCQGSLAPDQFGRDHHPLCFSIWMAGGGVRAGTVYGHTDEYGYNIANADGEPIEVDKSRDTPGAVHVHDLHATILHLLGLDHERLWFKHQGRRHRLTDVHGFVKHDLIG